MPRLRFAEDRELDDEKRRLIAAAERTGAPDPRVVRIMVRSSAGLAWVRCCCGYCSTVRSSVARDEGLTEALVEDLLNGRRMLSPKEKAALEYADLFKSGDEAIDSDAVYRTLSRHFTEEEIVELGMLCAQTVGVGRFVRSLNILSWEEACALNPALSES